MGKAFTIADGLENMGPLRTGGQGSVYKGRRSGAIFSAVKLLPTPICNTNNDDKNFRDFQNEVLKLKKVNEEPNPYVVKILNSGLTDSGGFPFIEMEYIEGSDLEDLIKPPHDSVFTINEVIKVANQLANALAHCHKAGIKHGDIKSNNVKFNIHSGNYILLDFGLAIMSDEQRRTSMRYAGAIEFMAPEQSEGLMLPESDVYSFGIILYELLAGRVPFPLSGNGETARNTVMISHLEAPVPDIRTFRRQNLPEKWSDERKEQEMQIPGWLLNVITKCLQKKPENRYENGISLYEDIATGSTLCVTETESVNKAVVLQQENERLHKLLINYKQTLNDRDLQVSSITQLVSSLDSEISAVKNNFSIYPSNGDKVSIPKVAFIALVIVLLSLSAFTGYSIFSNKETNKFTAVPPDDTVLTTEKPRSDKPTLETANLRSDSISPENKQVQVHKKSLVTKEKIVSANESTIAPDNNEKRSSKKLRQEEKKQDKVSKKKGKFIEVKFIIP